MLSVLIFLRYIFSVLILLRYILSVLNVFRLKLSKLFVIIIIIFSGAGRTPAPWHGPRGAPTGPCAV